MLKSKIKKINSKQWRILALPLLILVAFAFSGLYNLVSAAPDKVINYQGKLTDNSNVPVADTNYSIQFTIWDAVSGGNCLWSAQGSCGTPTAKTVATVGGVFSSMLGEAGDNAITMDFNSNYWLQIKVGSDDPMTPRRQITVSGYAINAGSLDGQAASYYLNTSATSQTKAGALTVQGIMTVGDSNADYLTLYGANTSGDIRTSGGALTITPNGGSNLNVNLSGAGDLAVNTNQLYVDTSAGYVGIGTTAPSAMFSVGSASSFQVTSSGMIGLGGTTPLFSLGVDATDSNKFKIYSGSSITGTSEFTIDQNGLTSISNLELGSMNFADNSGQISWVDMGVNGTASDNTIESYSAQLDGNPMFTIFGLSDGAGGVDNLKVLFPNGNVGIGTTAPDNLLSVAGDAYISGNVGIGTTADSLYALKINNGDLYLGSGGNGYLKTRNGGGGGFYLEQKNQTDQMISEIDLGSNGDISFWAYDIVNGGGNNGELGINLKAAGANLDGGRQMIFSHNSPVSGTGENVSFLFSPIYSGMTSPQDGYTALKINVEDAGVGATAPRYLLDLQVGNGSKFSVNSDGNTRLIGNLGIGNTSGFYSILQANQGQAANLTYTLPTAYTSSNGYVLSSTTGGAMSWVAGSKWTETTGGLSTLSDISKHTDNFNRANINDITGETAPTWEGVSGMTALAIDSNALYANQSSINMAAIQSGSLAGDQYVKYTVSSIGGTQNAGGFLRTSGTGNGDGYFFILDQNSTKAKYFFKLTAGSYGVPVVSGTLTDALKIGDVVEGRAVGSTMKVYVNGTEVLSYTDSTWTSGKAGIYGSNLAKVDNYESGEYRLGTVYPTFIAEGDSLTQGSSCTPTGTCSWADSSKIGKTGMSIFNEAFSGEALNTILGQYATQVHPHTKAVTGNECIAALWAGTGDINDLGRSAAQIEGDLTTWWGDARADGCTVVAFTIMDKSAFDAGMETIRNDVNDWIIAHPELYDYVVRPDLYFSLGDLGDGIHLSDAQETDLANRVNAIVGFYQQGVTTGIYNAGYVGIGTTSPLATLDVNGAGVFGAGSVNNPSIAFRADLDTGFWSSGANTINFSTNAIERMRVDSSGNVGIGTAAPTYKLQVAGTLGVGGTAYFAGNVGIGITAPASLLHLQGNTNQTQLIVQGAVLPATPVPTDVAGLKAWHKADAITANDNDALSAWTDSSGNGNNLAQGTGINQPIYKTSIMNGKPVVRFDGSNDNLASTFGTGQSSPYTVFVVSQFSASGTSQKMIFDGVSDASAAIFRSVSNDAWYVNNGSQIGPATGASDVKHVYTAVFNGSSSSLSIDGGTPATGTLGTPSLAGITVGCRGNGTECADADIPEVIVYSGALSASDIDTVETYLGDKYGITVANVVSGTQTAALQKWMSANGGVLGVMSSTGNLGIGTTNPLQNLSVNGTLGVSSSSAPYYTIFQGGGQLGNITYTLPTTTPVASGYALVSTTDGVMSWAAVGGGNIGIGTTVSSATSGSIFFAGNSGILQQDDANLFWDDSVNNLGIGTTNPLQNLSVNGTLGIASSSAPYYTIFQGGGQAGNLTYTLPTGYAASSGYVLSSTDAGVMSWVANGAGSGYNTVLDEATPLTQRTSLAFLGDAIACVDNNSQTECTVSMPTSYWAKSGESVFLSNDLTPIMTDNTAPSGVASASTIYNSSYEAWKAFTKSTGTAWASASSSTTGWLQYQFPSAKVVSAYSFYCQNVVTNGPAAAPTSWTFEGSNNGSSWDTLDTQAGVTSWAIGSKKTFSFSNTTSYLYYRVNVSANNGGSYLAISKLEMFRSSSDFASTVVIPDSSTKVQQLMIGSDTPYFPNADVVYVEKSLPDQMLMTLRNTYSGTSPAGAQFTVVDDIGNTGGLGISNSNWPALGDGVSPGETFVASYGSSSANLAFLTQNAGTHMRFGINSQEKMRIDSNGNIGIATTAPAYKLHVAGTLGIGGTAYFAGNVGAGTTNPLQKLSVNGNFGIASTSAPYYTIFQGNGQVGNVTYTLPVESATGLLKNTAGVWSWDATNYASNPMTTIGDIIYASNTATPATPQRLGAGTNGQILQSNTGAAPSWSTAAYPSTTVANQILYSDSVNNVTGLTSLGSAFLTTSAASAPQYTLISADTFTQYALLAGRSTGQTLNGGTGASENLTLSSTTNGTKGKIIFGTTGSAFDQVNTRLGIGMTNPAYKLDISTTAPSDRGINIAQTAATGSNYGIYSSVTGAATTNVGGYFVATGAGNNVGLQVAGMTGAGSTGLDIGAMSGATANIGINIGAMSGAIDTGIKIGAISGTGVASAIETGNITATGSTAFQLSLGAISGNNGTAHTGISLGNISGTTTNAYGINTGTMTGGTGGNYGLKMGAMTNTGTTNVQIDLGAMSGTVAASSNYGIRMAAISSAGTTSNNYGIFLNTLTGGTTSNSQIATGAITVTGTNNYGINVGGLTGTMNASTNYGINLGNINSTGTTTNNYGLNVGTVTGATTANYGINLTSMAATASATNYGINIGGLTGTAASSTNYGLNIGTMSATGTATYGMKIAGPTGAATSNYGLNIVAPSGATHNAALELGTASTGSGTWALYSSIANSSYFAGSVGIGTDNPSQGLLTVSGGNMALLGGNDMLFYDADNSAYVGFQATSVSGASLIYTLPGSAPASNGYALVSQTDGTLSWASAGGMSNPMTSQGDLIYGGVGGAPTALAGGASNYVLSFNTSTSAPQWTAPGAASVSMGSAITGSVDNSVLFVGSGGVLAQDNANFSWNDTENSLAIGGKVTVSGTTSNIVKTSSGNKSLSTDFEYNGTGTAPQLVSVTANQNALELSDGTVGFTTGPGDTSTVATVGAGAHSIVREDGKIIIIHGGGAITASLWDGVSGSTMTSMNVGVGSTAAGAGAISLKRPNGRYLMIAGGGGTNNGSTSVFDPWSVAAPANGPQVCGGSAITTGTNAFMRPDGRYQILCGGFTSNGVYDPSLAPNLGYSAGPTAPGSFGAGAHALQRDDGTFMIMTGGNSTTNGVFNPQSNNWAGTAPGLTSNVTTGALSIRRQDGKYLVIPGTAGVSFLYDPVPTMAAPNGTFTSAPSGPSVALGDGAQILWRQDGKYILITGNGATVNIVNIEGSSPIFTSGTQYNIASVTAGTHLVPRPDGKYQIIRGAAAPNNTYSLDIGYVIGGMIGVDGTASGSAYWESECISTTSLNPTSTLSWTKNAEGSINVLVRTGATCASLSAYKNVPNSGDEFNPAVGDNKVQMRVFLKRNFPTSFDQDWGLWRGLSQTKYRRRVMDPVLYDITINNSSLFHRTQFDLGSGVSANQDASGPVAANVNVAANGSLQLSQGFGNGNLASSTNPVGTGYAGQFGTHNPLNQVSGEGNIAMRRPNGTYMILVAAPIIGGTNPPTTTAPVATIAEIYDPSAQTFTNNATANTAASYGVVCNSTIGSGFNCAPNIYAGTAITIGRGSLAFKRPDGKFFIVNGQGGPNGGTAPNGFTSVYDPVSSTFSTGPTLVGLGTGGTSPNAGRGSQALTLPNGNVLIMHGDFTKMTSIYNPLQNTMIPGPTAPANIGTGTLTIPRPDGTWLIAMGLNNTTTADGVACTVQTTTYLFDPYAMRFMNNHVAIATGLGPGAFTFQRSDGNWVIVHGAGTSNTCVATNRYQVYNAVSNQISASQSLTAPATFGASSMQRPDGTWLIMGGSGPQTSVYVEKGGVMANGIMAGTAVAANIMAGTSPANAGQGPGVGAFNLQRDDGKYIQILGLTGVYGSAPGATGPHVGNTTATVLQYDAGWVSSGTYKTEQLSIPDLDASSTLSWKVVGGNSAGITAEVKTASTFAGLQTASTRDIQNGGSINPSGTAVQVNFNFSRSFPSKEGIWSDVWMGGIGVKNQTWRNILNPALSEFKINKDSDLLNLKADGLSLFRVSSNGDIYTSANGSVRTGGADLAENYSSQEFLEKGEVVAIDPINDHSVKKALYQNQSDVVGVVSSDPGFVAGSYTEDSYPIALVGRVPVKVSTENGMIKAGDYLTAASVPGHAMRATRSGRVLGKALENLDATKLEACPEGGYPMADRKCGIIMMFVNLMDYSGMSVETLMAEVNTSDQSLVSDAPIASVDGLTVAVNPSEKLADSASFADYSKQAEILDFLKKLKESEAQSPNASEIFTGRLSADEVISPNMFVDVLVAKKIKADSIEGLEFLQTGMAQAQDGVTVASSQIGNLGTEIETLKKQMTELTLSGITLAKFANLEATGGIVIGGPSEFQGPAVFKAMAEFLDKTVFQKDVEFAGTATFNNDMAGYAVIKTKSNGVKVTFDKEYAVSPIVTAALSLQYIKDEEVRKASEELLLVSDVKFIITNVTEKGFEIRINQVATSDIPFAWQAVTVKDAQTSESADIIDPLPEIIPALPSEAENVIIPPTETIESQVPVVSETAIESEMIPAGTDPIAIDDEITNL
jgi:hypothetical protein